MFIFGIHDCVQRAAAQRQTYQTRITINPPRNRRLATLNAKHFDAVNFPLILQLPRCDSPTPYTVGLSYHGSSILLFFRIANADNLASQIANSGGRGIVRIG